MSEPDQLLVQVRLSPGSYKAFRSAPPPAASRTLEWEAWLSDKRYHGPPIGLDEIENRYCRYRESSVDGFLRAVAESDDSGFALDQYDLTREEWTYRILDYSENYGDFIKMLNVLQSVAPLKDRPGRDHALIFGHFYQQSQVVALLRVDAGRGTLVGELDDEATEFIERAKASIDAVIGA